MENESRISYAVMESKGAYNRHGTIPASGAAMASPFLDKAVKRIALDPEDQPVVIADYGSSQGKNSLKSMGLAIRALQPRIRHDRPILVFHIDQPSNDFNTLFEVLDSDPDRYALEGANVFPCAIGRSFYQQLLPTESVHLGWSSYAAVWLSRIPCFIPNHFFPPASTGETRAAFERQAADDWKAFLSFRAREMRPGARLVVVLPGLPDNRVSGFVEVMNQANAILGEMVDEGAITSQERGRMVLALHARRKDELLAPFVKERRFQGLTVEDCDTSPLPDTAWDDYQRDSDGEALARKRALFFRAVFMPSLATALNGVRNSDAAAQSRFADRLQEGLIRRLSSHPAPSDMFVETVVLAKSE